MELALIIEGRRRLYKVCPKFTASFDVAVVGLGTAGAESFRHCLQQGLKALGLERLSGSGGMTTLGCICFGDGIVNTLRGLEREFADADVMYGTSAFGAWIENRRIVGVRTVANGIVHDFKAKIVIDATGNGTVARLAGVRLRKGRAIDGMMAPCARGETWMDVDTGRLRPIYRNYPFDLACKSREYSNASSFMAGERHKFWISQKGKCRLIRPSLMIGAREECRVETEEVVALGETLAGRRFHDPIFYAFEPEDLPVFYDDHAFESESIRNWKVHCGLPFFCYPATLPYGTIVAKGVDGLLVPSKHFGVAHDLGGGIRMQGAMRKTGVAAALAASVAIRRGCALKDVPYSELEPMLQSAGNLVPPRNNRVNTYRGHSFAEFTTQEVVEALSHDIARTGEWWYAVAKNEPAERAAYAYWTAWKLGMPAERKHSQELADALVDAMAHGGRFAGNYAVALGLMRDLRALPALRRLVADPTSDPIVPRAFPNRIKAIDFLGRFSDRESIQALLNILRDEAVDFTAGLAEAKAFANADMCRFQALSYSLRALQAILARYPDAAIIAELEQWCNRPRVLRGWDGADIADRLKNVRFNRRIEDIDGSFA